MDVTQYPILPWIISEYNASEIDLLNGNCNSDKKNGIYRNLFHPMGASNNERLGKYFDQYNEYEVRTYYSNPVGYISLFITCKSIYTTTY